MDEQNLTIGYLLKYIKHEIQRIAARPDARNSPELGWLMSSLTVISDAAAHNAKRLGGEYSKVIGIADVLYANIQDIGHDVQWKSIWPSDEEIDWAVLHERERGLKYPFDTGSSQMPGDST